MRVLYGIQGTGNGHLSRAQELIPALRRYARVDVLISGNQSQLDTDLEFDYKMSGLTFVQGKKGSISWSGTLKNFHFKDFYRSVRSLPVESYDLIISDFEPVSAWAARLRGIPSVELSHQAAVIHPSAPKPDRLSVLGKFVLNNYCPSSSKFGLHFDSYAPSIFTPIIRRSIRQLSSVDGTFKQFECEWHVFSRHTSALRRQGNVVFHPIDQKVFVSHLEQCGGVLCGAGFELPSEAIYLEKKLMVIPLAGQYEQYCNAQALKNMGIEVMENLDLIHYRTMYKWLNSEFRCKVNYPENTDLIAQEVLNVREGIREIEEVKFSVVY
jgi:hypothetical protein